jgi:hypothetical protein
MERLIKEASALDSSIDANSLSFDNIVKAIRVVQTEMGITGTTAREAGTTIQGSIGAMKAAWENLLTGFSDKSANIPQLVNNLVTSIVGDGTENNLGVLGNILPAIETALGGISEIIKVGVPKILEEIIPVIGGSLPIIAEMAMYLVTSLADGLSSALPTLFDTVIDAVNQIADVFMSDEGLSTMFDAAITLLTTFLETFTSAEGLEKANNAIFNLVDALSQFLLKPETIAMLIEAGIRLIVSMTVGMLAQRLFLFKTMGKVLLSIGEAVLKTDWAELGKNVVIGFRKGIENSWKNLKNWFKSLFGDLIAVAKKILGIASPSKAFKKLGGFTAEGFGIGFENEFAHVKDDMEDALNFDDASVGINASIRKVGAGTSGVACGGTSIGNININIDGAKYTDEQSLAEAVAQAIQDMTDRRYAVYA